MTAYIPTNISTLGDVADFVNGAAFKPEDWGETGKKIIRIQNLTDKSKPFNRTLRGVSERLHVHPGDLLVSWSATLGVYEWDDTETGVLNQHIFRVLPDVKKVDKRYLKHALELALLDMRKHLHGATMLHVNRGEFLSTRLYLPSLPEQRRIAAILNQADTLRAKRREALAQLDSLTQSIYINMFGNFSKERISIGEMIESGIFLLHKDGNHGSLYPRSEDFGESGTPFLSAKSISEDGDIDYSSIEYLREEKAARLRLGWIKKGDVLLAHNASVGKVALYDGRFESALIGTSLTAFRPNQSRLNSDFLAASLKSEDFQRQLEKNMGQTTRNQVPITAQRNLMLSLPPLELQLLFSKRIDAIRKQKALLKLASVELDSFFISLQHRAFRGEL